ncbi:MAG TPA: hypothetical protein VEJ39_00815 [Candidatus Acidoferrales bacterium]|nr:hypothetical protein [Candidatus Acidoferrales bacterium]
MKHCTVIIGVLFLMVLNSSCGKGYGSSSGSGSGGGSGVTASITNSVTTLQAGASYTFTATTPSSYGYTAGISWTISPATGAGTLSTASNSGYSSSVTYQAPTAPPSPNSVTITATPSDTAVGTATDTFTISASSMSTLNGQFAIQFSGFDASGETLGAVGSVKMDGAGNITAGSIDLNQNHAPSVRIVGVTGAYTLDSDMHGTISLAAAMPGSDRPLAFSFALAADALSGVITGSEVNGVAISGRLLRQDSSAFAAEKISGDFAFKLESNSADCLATDGKLAIESNSILSGIADSSESGIGPIFTSAQVSGRITAPPDATGRGTFTLATPAKNSPFVFYVVSESRLLLMETASATTHTRQLGVAQRQTMPFAPSTANASSAFRASGFDLRASVLGPVSVTGTLAIENFTHASLAWDASSAGITLPHLSLRSDAVTFDPSTGRGTINIANGFANNFADSVAFYLASPGEGFLVDTTAGSSNRGIAGDLDSLPSQ